jgi:hypothetical protein
MAEKKKTDEQTEGEPLNARDEQSLKTTGGDPIAPARQLPAAGGATRYRVRVSALGRWVQGDELTAEDVGGEERAKLLAERGAIEEVPANQEG